MEVTAYSLWSTPILSVKYPEHAKIKAGLVEQCYAMEKAAATRIESGITPQIKSNLYESRFDFFRSAQTPEVQALKQFCGMALSHSVVRLHQQNNPAAPQAAQVGVDLFESWVHVTRDRGYHDVHYHPNCSWCGIYYVEIGQCTLTPPNGVNRFFPPFHVGYEDYGAAACNRNAFSPPPEEGRLVLFPAYVEHSAAPYHGSTDRIVISFNARVMPVARPNA
jgi:uncharacterized protein (TIGR02466 family)